MFKIGLSSCGKEISEELFASYKTAGIEAIEISLRPGEAAPSLSEIRKMADSFGVIINSYHLPFMPFSSLDISKAELAKDSVLLLSDIIRRGATEGGIDLFVIHPSGEPIEAEDRAERMACAKQSLATLAEVAASVGATIAVENLPRTCLARNALELLELLSADDRLRVCFDTNHLLEGDPLELIRAVGDKIVTTHVSDYDLLNERHWLPGEGVVDWPSLCSTLREVGYRGVWLYELGFKSPETVLRERELCCADFVRNAREIFDSKPITRLSGIGSDLLEEAQINAISKGIERTIGMYLYETHLHTSPVSRCARADVRESLAFYKALGYAGVFITNHFIDGNINIDKALPYAEKIAFYCSDYENGLEIARELGISLFFGVEMSYGGTDFLIYGLPPAWYAAHPEIEGMKKSALLKFLAEEGALIIQAHPFREAEYIDHIRLYPRLVHGVEVYNASRPDADNKMAELYAEHYGLLRFAGSDNHTAQSKKTLGGMRSQTPIKDELDFVRRFKNGELETFALKNEQ